MLQTLRLLLVELVLAPTDFIAAAERPSIVVVLIDDLGYGVLGCYGNAELRTPNLGRFATEGLRQFWHFN